MSGETQNGKMSAEELERALAFLEHHERGAFPQRSESQAASSIRAHIATLQREAEAERTRADAMREALQTIAIGYVVAGGVIRDAAGGVMDYVEPEEKPLRSEVAQSIARAALNGSPLRDETAITASNPKEQAP